MSERPVFGQTDPRNYRPGSPPKTRDLPAELAVTEHMVGYTQITINNGDVIRFHMFVDRLVLNPDNGSYEAQYRMVPENVRAVVRDDEMPSVGRA